MFVIRQDFEILPYFIGVHGVHGVRPHEQIVNKLVVCEECVV